MQKSTQDKILDTAERLFAQQGFHGASLRDITSQARVNLGSVNYHFKSKQGLMQAVLARRISPLNSTRLQSLRQALDQASAAHRPPAARDILQAFLEPTLRMRDACQGTKHFVTLIGRILYESDATIRNIFLDQMLPVFGKFLEALILALPHIPGEVLSRRLLFAIGAMGHTLCLEGRVPSASAGIDLNRDTQYLLEHLLTFVTAGMEAPCAEFSH